MESSTVQQQTTRSIPASMEGTNPPAYSSLRRTARHAGLLYFFIALMGFYGFMYVPSKIFVEGNAAATASNILAHEFLFRTGIVNALASAVLFVMVVLVLYRLFKHVNEHLARLMVALVLVQIPVGFVLEVFQITSLMILKGQLLQTLPPEQKQNMAMLFLETNHYGAKALEIFWGAWLFPFGWLAYHSGFIPRILGVLLIANGIAYIIDNLAFLLFPSYAGTVSTYLFPLFFGELLIILWLLIKGIKTPAVKPAI